MQSIEVNKINDILKVALSNIKINFRTLNEKSGWHQYLGSDKIGNIATAQALIILDVCNEDFNHKHLAFKYLKSSQQRSNDLLKNGGWAYITNFSELPTTECTCWALLALYEEYSNKATTKKGLNWLLNNHPNETKNIGWGTIKSDIPRVYSTCLALRVLQKYKYENSEQFKNSLNWLLNSQNTDFGWGEQFGHKSTIFHTSFVITTLVDIYKLNNSSINNGMKWLTKNFNSAIENSNSNIGSQEIIDFDFITNGERKHQRLIYFHTPLPQAINAFVKTGNIFNKNVFLALEEIVNNNNSGYWKHPNFDDSIQKPLWLIYDMVISLKSFTSTIKNWDNIKKIELKNNKLILVSNTNPFNWDIFLSNFILGIWGKIFAVLLASLFIIYVTKIFPDWSAKSYVSILLFPLIAELLGYYITEIRKSKK